MHPKGRGAGRGVSAPHIGPLWGPVSVRGCEVWGVIVVIVSCVCVPPPRGGCADWVWGREPTPFPAAPPPPPMGGVGAASLPWARCPPWGFRGGAVRCVPLKTM